jgi:hypothetical protein
VTDPGIALGYPEAKFLTDIVVGPYMSALGTDESPGADVLALAPLDYGAATLAAHREFKLFWPLHMEEQISRIITHTA